MNDSDKYALIILSLLKEVIVLFFIFMILFIFFSLAPSANPKQSADIPTLWEKFIVALGTLGILLKTNGVTPYSFTALFIIYYITTLALIYFNKIQPPRNSKRNRKTVWYDYIMNEMKERLTLILFGPIVLFVLFSILYGILKTASHYDWKSNFIPLQTSKKIGILLVVMFYIYVMIEVVYAWLTKKSIFPASEPEFNLIRVIFLYPTLIAIAVMIYIFLFLTRSSTWVPFLFSSRLMLTTCLLILCMVYLTNIFMFFNINTFIAMLFFILVCIYIFYKKQNTT